MADEIQFGERMSDTMAVERNRPEAFYQEMVGLSFTVNGMELIINGFLGIGNMSGVLRASFLTGDNAGTAVAVKILSPDLSMSERYVERFRIEAAAMMDLPPHPNIVGCRFHGFDLGTRLHVMGLEYVDGGSLDALEKPLPVKKACSIIRQAAKGLAVAHARKKIHRDIKPANIMLSKEGTAKLTDFGLVRGIGDVRHTVAGVALGTPLYMAPEQIRGRANFGSDLYSLGATLYELVTGKPPYFADDMDELFALIENEENTPAPPRSLNPSVSLELEDMILRTLSKDFKQRHLTADELIEDLDHIENQSLDRQVREKWLALHGTNPAKRKVFDLVAASQSFSLAEEPALPVFRQIIEECRSIERADLSAEIEGFEPDKADYDGNLRYLEKVSKLLRVTLPTQQTVLTRMAWIEAMLEAWTGLVGEDPSLGAMVTSMQYRLAFEDARRARFGVERPVPPRSFGEVWGWPLAISAIVLLVLSTAGLMSFIIGSAHHRSAERRREKYETLRLYRGLVDRINRGDPAGIAEDLKDLRARTGRMEDLNADSLLLGLEDRFARLLENLKVEKQLAAVEALILKAGEALDAGAREGAGREAVDSALREAAALRKQAALALGPIPGERAESLRRSLDALAGRIGPRLVAFETFDAVASGATDLEAKLEALKARWQADGALPQGLADILSREASAARDGLVGVRADFREEDGEPTGQYLDLLNRIEEVLKRARDFHREISYAQIRTALETVQSARTEIDELEKEDSLLSERGPRRLSAAGAMTVKAEELLKNAEGSPDIGREAPAQIREALAALRRRLSMAASRLQEIGEERKRAASDPVLASTFGTRLYFAGLLTEAEPFFRKALEKPPGPVPEGTLSQEKMTALLRVIEVQKKIQAEAGKPQAREERRARPALLLELAGEWRRAGEPARAAEAYRRALDSPDSTAEEKDSAAAGLKGLE